MYNANKPDASELPSTGQLLRSAGIAAVVATALLVTNRRNEPRVVPAIGAA